MEFSTHTGASQGNIYQGEEKEEGEDGIDVDSIWESAITSLPTEPQAQTKLDETSTRHGKAQIVSVFSVSNVPASRADQALTVIDKLLERALQETTGDEISKRMASVSGVANKALEESGSSTVINAHHVQTVGGHPGTFTETRKGRLGIPKKYRDAIVAWGEKNPNHTKAQEAELKEIVRDQIMHDEHLNLEKPLEMVEMIITTAKAHRAHHRREPG